VLPLYYYIGLAMFAPVTTSLIYVFLGAQMRINLNLYLFVIHVVSNFIKLRVPNITSPSGLSELAALGVEIFNAIQYSAITSLEK
jgi:hypothetical protein